MLRAALLGLAAAAVLAAGATAADAKVNVDVHFGVPGFYTAPVYDPYPYPHGYDEDCYYVTKKKKVKVAPGVYKIKTFEVLKCY